MKRTHGFQFATSVKWAVCVLIFLFLGGGIISSVGAENPTPEFLIKQVVNTYRSLATYRVIGESITEGTKFDRGGETYTITVRFSLTLKKPNLYRITWEEDHPPYYFNSQGAAWNAGVQPYLYLQSLQAYMKVPTDLAALNTVAGVSKGATYLIPQLFFPFYSPNNTRLEGLEEPRITGIEEIQGERCFVLTGGNDGLMVTYWISVERYLIRQYVHVEDLKKGTETIKKMTDKEVEQSLRSLGVEPTEIKKREVKDAFELTSKIRSKNHTQIVATHYFSHISLPVLTSEDLVFAVPEGIPLKEDIYESPISVKAIEILLDQAEKDRK